MSKGFSLGKKSIQLSKKILRDLLCSPPGPYRPQIWSGAHYTGIRYVPQQKVSAEVYWATVRRMKKQGWVVEAHRQGKKFLKLTKRGKVQALLALIKESVQKRRSTWDGKWRVAIFDIPEQDGQHERYRIRQCLTACGFHFLQKSVYIYPYEIPGHVIAYLRESGLDQFIKFLRVDRIDDSYELERRFQVRRG